MRLVVGDGFVGSDIAAWLRLGRKGVQAYGVWIKVIVVSKLNKQKQYANDGLVKDQELISNHFIYNAKKAI